MPIQRVPRYTLLLNELMKNTSELHPEKEALAEAIKMSEDLGRYLDECKDDKISRLVAIQLSLGSTCEVKIYRLC